jgi:hypothetical protein
LKTLRKLLWNEFEIRFSLPKRTDDSSLKLPEEKNSFIAMELEIGLARTRKCFLFHSQPDGFSIQPQSIRQYFHGWKTS